MCFPAMTGSRGTGGTSGDDVTSIPCGELYIADMP